MSGNALTEDQWTTMTRLLFIKSGLYFEAVKALDPNDDKKIVVVTQARGVTNQGIRRTAAQWAGRCGCKMILDLANNGRWKSLDTIAVYMGQGAKTRQEAEFQHGSDPIFRTWVWKPVTMAGISTKNML